MISHMLFFPIWYVLKHSNVGKHICLTYLIKGPCDFVCYYLALLCVLSYRFRKYLCVYFYLYILHSTYSTWPHAYDVRLPKKVKFHCNSKGTWPILLVQIYGHDHQQMDMSTWYSGHVQEYIWTYPHIPHLVIFCKKKTY